MPNEDLEREKFAFEQKKWTEAKAIEEAKISLEQKRMWVSTGGIVIPLLVVALTILWNTKAQETQSRADFELKAAEAILEPRTVSESQKRAEGLVALFPSRFPSDFPNRLIPLREKIISEHLQKPDMDKARLLNLLVTTPKEQRKEILELWFAFYPTDRDYIPQEVITILQHH